MQRIALLACAMALLLAGCQTPAPNREFGPPPPPILSTRTPRVVEPIPPPRAEEAPKLPPRGGGAVSLADIQVPGGIERHRWKVIVVHHSDSAKSSPQGMDSWHRQRGWECLGYHFVIGNGINYPDGQLFVGPRWRQQKTGAHTKASAGRYFGTFRADNFFNEHGIGICLIGDFEHGRPTARQLQTLQDLIAVLSGATDASVTQVYGHGEVTHKTACPGRLMDMGALRRAVAAAAREPTDDSAPVRTAAWGRGAQTKAAW
jgi:hypothetical protein